MRRLAVSILVVVLTLMTSVLTPAIAGMDEALGAYKRGDYAAAFSEFEALAKTGSVAAQYNIAQMYRYGQGVAQNYPAAIEWYEKAAGAGLSSAQNNLAHMHMEGKGGEVDYATAVRWWNRAALQDHVSAQFNMGAAYQNGRGVAADPLEAMFWYSLATLNGYVGARPIQERLAATMNVEQLIQVTERVNKWQPISELLPQ
ncbi:MAG: tetratricopeptide repeat protein [Alphaproteobacteria bacterium]|nr:tetratricopeptide repeat protein [Alphaproteobacteria bacterium]